MGMHPPQGIHKNATFPAWHSPWDKAQNPCPPNGMIFGRGHLPGFLGGAVKGMNKMRFYLTKCPQHFRTRGNLVVSKKAPNIFAGLDRLKRGPLRRAVCPAQRESENLLNAHDTEGKVRSQDIRKSS